MRDDNFEWDDEKAARKVHVHDVSFDVAREAFVDPHFLEEEDPDPHEERYKRICIRESVLYVVIYTERSQRTRIISARKVNRHEQRLYFNR